MLISNGKPSLFHGAFKALQNYETHIYSIYIYIHVRCIYMHIYVFIYMYTNVYIPRDDHKMSGRLVLGTVRLNRIWSFSTQFLDAVVVLTRGGFMSILELFPPCLAVQAMLAPSHPCSCDPLMICFPFGRHVIKKECRKGTQKKRNVPTNPTSQFLWND